MLTPLQLLEATLVQIDASINGIKQRNKLYPYPPNVLSGEEEILQLTELKKEYECVINKLTQTG